MTAAVAPQTVLVSKPANDALPLPLAAATATRLPTEDKILNEAAWICLHILWPPDLGPRRFSSILVIAAHGARRRTLLNASRDWSAALTGFAMSTGSRKLCAIRHDTRT
jgi:hypothetical protein